MIFLLKRKRVVKMKIKKVAILTNGGDAPGLNAVIRAICKTCEKQKIEVYGYIEGYKGLLENNYVKLSTNSNASGILAKGGTIISSSNATNVFNLPSEKNGKKVFTDESDKCVENIKKAGFDCIFTLGGDGTQKSARDFSLKGINIIGIPKTIDNDVAHTDITFGYNTAVSIATEALDRLHTTAESHKRILVLEVMGRYTGWIGLESGIAGGADVILIPEIPFDYDIIAKSILKRKKTGKEFAIVVVSEGAKEKDGEIITKRIIENSPDGIRLGGIGERVSLELEKRTGLESRNTVLGYVQRGGTPTSFDRVLSTKYGSFAVDLALKGIFNVLVTLKDNKLTYVTLEDVVGANKVIGAVSGNTAETNIKRVTLDNDLIKVARAIDICLGDE